jgi:Uncharacterized protein conserved in bacteria
MKKAGKKEPKRRKPVTKDCRLEVRMTEDQRAEIGRLAAEAGMTRTDWILQAATKKSEGNATDNGNEILIMLTVEVKDNTRSVWLGNPYGLACGERRADGSATRWLVTVSDVPDDVTPMTAKKAYERTTDTRLVTGGDFSAPVPYASLGAGKIIR